MSAPEALPVILVPPARQDFITILRYTGQTRSQPKLTIYRDRIDAAILAFGRIRNSSVRETIWHKPIAPT